MSERRGIAVVLAAAFLLRLAFVWVLPVFQAPDEEAHFRYVEYLGERRALPVQPERSLELFADPMHQAYQPPLAYASLVPVERTFATLGAPLHVRLRALRVQNALYGTATVLIGVVVAMRLTRRGDPRRLLTALALAFLPGFVAVGAAVNNDSLANLLAAALWLALIPAAGREASAWRSGAVLGAACLAKLSNLALAPLLFAVPLLRDRRNPVGALRFAAIAIATASVSMLPWMLHNVARYGDPLAIGVGSLAFDWLESVLPADALSGLSRVRYANAFFQFWGRFGIANNLAWVGVPVALVPISLLAAVGWLRGRARSDARTGPDAFDAWAPAWLIAAALSIAALVQFSLVYAGAWQGRYLYSAMLPFALLFAGGWSRLLPSGVSANSAHRDSESRGRAERPAANSHRVVLALAVLLAAINVVVLVKLGILFAQEPPGRWLLFTRL
jgi:hypothetical protein